MTISSGNEPTKSRKVRSPERRSGKQVSSAAIEEARAIAAEYRLTLEEVAKNQFEGSCMEIPTVFGSGETVEKCVADTRETLVVTLAKIIDDGGLVPASAREGKRDQQVNVRFTIQERTFLEAAARAEGFRSVADLVRKVALARLTAVSSSGG